MKNFRMEPRTKIKGKALRVLIILFLWVLLGSVSEGMAFSKKPSSAKKSDMVTKYACPMQCHFSEKPGKCSKCGMEMWEVSPSEK